MVDVNQYFSGISLIKGEAGGSRYLYGIYCIGKVVMVFDRLYAINFFYLF
jgi:hypothetical protein